MFSDTTISLSGIPSNETEVQKSEFVDRSATGTDFNCADNWVVSGTSSNPGFDIPCFQDKATFPEDRTFMVNIPSNVFVSSLIFPAGPSIISDQYQFSGANVSLQAGACPQPFGSMTGIEFCQAWCVNTCPELNPNPRVATETSIADLKLTSGYTADALAAANAALANQSIPVVITGGVSFAVSSDVPQNVIASVISLIQATLPTTSSFPISFTVCVLSLFFNLSLVYLFKNCDYS